MNTKYFHKMPWVACAFFSSYAWAQSADHSGNSLGLQFTSSKLKNTLISGGDNLDTASWGNLTGIRFDHLQPLNDNWLVGFVGDFNLSEQKSTRAGADGTPIVVSTNNDPAYTYTPATGSTTRLKRQLSLQAQIGYAFNTSQMILGRIGWHKSKTTVTGNGEAVYSDACIATAPYCQEQVALRGLTISSGASSGKAYLQGYSLALAYRHNISKNLYVQLEGQKVFYRKNSELSIKPSSLDYGVGFGYRF